METTSRHIASACKQVAKLNEQIAKLETATVKQVDRIAQLKRRRTTILGAAELEATYF